MLCRCHKWLCIWCTRWSRLSLQTSNSSRPEFTWSVALPGRAEPLLRLINAAETEHIRHRAVACVTELQLHYLCLCIRLSAVSKVAQVYLGMSSTSVPVECMISTTGIISNGKRSSTGLDKLNRVVFSHDNFSLAVDECKWLCNEKVSWMIRVVIISVTEKIHSPGTEDGEQLIIELMITSHSHKFTQIIQMKSYQ